MLHDVVLVTGGAGFIGSAAIRHLIRETNASVINVDALTYAANPNNLTEVDRDPRYRFECVDICSAAELERIFSSYEPIAVLHIAAETRGSFDRRSTSFRADQRPWNSHPPEGRVLLLARALSGR